MWTQGVLSSKFPGTGLDGMWLAVPYALCNWLAPFCLSLFDWFPECIVRSDCTVCMPIPHSAVLLVWLSVWLVPCCLVWLAVYVNVSVCRVRLTFPVGCLCRCAFYRSLLFEWLLVWPWRASCWFILLRFFLDSMSAFLDRSPSSNKHQKPTQRFFTAMP